jgi:hypothetical protein
VSFIRNEAAGEEGLQKWILITWNCPRQWQVQIFSAFAGCISCGPTLPKLLELAGGMFMEKVLEEGLFHRTIFLFFLFFFFFGNPSGNANSPHQGRCEIDG